MSKASPSTPNSTNTSWKFSPIYAVGEKVFYTIKGTSAPCLIVAANGEFMSDSNKVAEVYTVVGDIRATNYPAGIGRGPFKNVPSTALTDRA